MRGSSYARVYNISFKDGTFTSICGVDIPAISAELICSANNSTLIGSHDFIAIRTRDGRDNVLIAIDTIKSIRIGNKKVDDYYRFYDEAYKEESKEGNQKCSIGPLLLTSVMP